MDLCRAVRRIALLLAVPMVLAAGCGDDSNPTAPAGGTTQESADDLAILGVVTLDFLGGDLEGIVNTTPVTATSSTQGTSRALADTSYARDGVTYEATRTYYDAGNTEIPYGPTAVRVSWTSRAYGTSIDGPDTVEVGHSSVLDVRGIEAANDTLRINGATYDTLLVRIRSLDGSRVNYFDWNSGVVVTDVRFLKSTLQAGPSPLSGTVTIAVSVDRLRRFQRGDIESHLDAFVVITFDGTTQADLMVDGRFRYDWNLVTGQITRA
jgi:hypothetical protein